MLDYSEKKQIQIFFLMKKFTIFGKEKKSIKIGSKKIRFIFLKRQKKIVEKKFFLNFLNFEKNKIIR